MGSNFCNYCPPNLKDKTIDIDNMPITPNNNYESKEYKITSIKEINSNSKILMESEFKHEKDSLNFFYQNGINTY